MNNFNINNYFSMLFSVVVIFFDVQSSFASITADEFFTNNLDPSVITAELGETKSGVSINKAICDLKKAIGGSGAPVKEISAINVFLDGTQSLSGFNNFTVTATATRSSNTVSITGNDGSPSQTYSILYAAPIAAGDTFTLTNGSKSIIFANSSGVSITSASALATYLTGAYPVNFVISSNAATKIAKLCTLLAGTNGGAAGANTSIYVQAMTVILTGSASGSLGAYLVVTPSGDDTADIQTINAFLNGLGSGLTTQARIGSIFSQIDGTADYSGNIAGKLTTQIQTILSSGTQISTAISAVATILGGTELDLYGNVGAANSALGGSGTLKSRVVTIYNALLASPTSVVITDLATARALLVLSLGATLQADAETLNALLNGTATGSTIEERIAAIFSQISNASSGNITDELTTFIQAIRSSGTRLSTVISDVSNNVGGTASDLHGNVIAANTALDGAQSLSGLTSFTVTAVASNPGGNTVNIVGDDDDLSSITYSMTYSSPIASGNTFTLVTGSKSITFVNNSGGSITSAAALTTYLANAYPVSAIIKANTNTKATALKSLLGGNNYSVISNAVAIFSILGGTNSDLYSNVGTVNSSLGGSGVTTLAKIGSLGSASSLFSMIGVTSLTDLAATLGNTGAGNSAIAALLNGSTGTSLYALLVGSSGILSQIDGTTTDSGNVSGKLTTQIQALNSSATQLSTAISAANSALGGSGTTINRTKSVNATLDGVQSLSGLTSFTVTTAVANSSGTISIMGNDGSSGRSYTVDTSGGGINLGDGSGGTTTIANGGTVTLTHAGSGNTITFVNNSGGSITSASSLATYLANAYPINSIVKASTSTKTTALKSLLGGAGYSAMSNAVAINNSLLTSSTGVVVNDLATARALFVISLGATLQADAQTLNDLLDGTAAGSTVQARIGNPTLGGSASSLLAIFGGTSTNIAAQAGDPGAGKTIISNIGGATTSVQDALNAGSLILFGNTNFSSSLYAQVSSMNSNLDNGLSSLPGGSIYATIGTAAASDGSGGVNIIISSGLGGGNGTYNLSSSTITSNIGSNSTFTLTNGSNNIVLYNRSGATISTQAQVINYLKSMYPSGSKIATASSDKISSLSTMVGGTASSARTRVAAITASFLKIPTGIARTDLESAQALFVASPGATMEDDAQTLNSSLNGTASGLTTQARIGAPNAYDGNLQNLVDGEATSDLNTGLTTLRTAIDGSSGAVVSGTGGADFEFAGYSGTTSQVFADENITVSSNTVTVKIGGEDYTYSASSSAINNGDTVSFTGSSGKLLLLTYAGGGVNNGNANANANDLQGALTSFFQVGSIITPGNLSSKVAVLEEGIDGATSGNAMAGLTNLKTAIDGSSSFSIAGTTGSDLTVPAYDGATSQVFGADAFSNGGTTTISVTIGTDTYTYDNTGVTNISGYGTIRFTNGSKSLIIQNNTGTPITAGTDQLIADAIVSALNTYFGGGSKLRAGNLRVKIGVPTVNGTPSNLAAVIGGSGIDMASLLGDPITADSGVSALIKASTASNDHGVFSDLSGFQNATDIKNQLSTFLALFSNLAGGATSVTFDFSGGAPTSLANLITAATSVT